MQKYHDIFKIRKQLINFTMGFTLIEVIIVVAIVGILASVAYPSYVNYVIRSDRTEAPRELTRIANLQEQFFVDNQNYTDNLSQLGLGLNVNFETESGNYIISSVVVNNSFILTATAQGRQAVNDIDCATMGINDAGTKTASTSSIAGPSVSSTNICWGL